MPQVHEGRAHRGAGQVSRLRATALIAAYLVLAGLVAHGQTTGKRESPLVIPSMAGQDLYMFYCASCHGSDAKETVRSHRRFAWRPRISPPQPRGLSTRSGLCIHRQRWDDAERSARVERDAHWGPIFVALDPSDKRAVIRIENVVQYLESIQEKGERP